MLEIDLRTGQHPDDSESHQDFLAAEMSNQRACTATSLKAAFTAFPELATWSIRLRPRHGCDRRGGSRQVNGRSALG
jgi:hypothetical protein